MHLLTLDAFHPFSTISMKTLKYINSLKRFILAYDQMFEV